MSKKKTPAISPLSMLSRKLGEDISIDEIAKNNDQKIFDQSSILVQEVDPNKGTNWQFHDRPESELGDITSLAEEFKDPSIGQQQPCIVRKLSDNSFYDFEVIAGERRWRAAKLAKTKLKVIFKQLDDKQASISQISENLNRQDLSDYSRGMSFAALIEKKLLTQKDLTEMFKLAPMQINRYLSFSQIPKDLWEAVGDMRKVSSRTSAEIRSILKKNPNYLKHLISLAPQIREGKLGSTTLSRRIQELANTKIVEQPTKLFGEDKNGNKMFTVSNKNNGKFEIYLEKELTRKINLEQFSKTILQEIQKLLT